MSKYDNSFPDSFPIEEETPAVPLSLKRISAWVGIVLGTISVVFFLVVVGFDIIAARQSEFRHVFYGEEIPESDRPIKVVERIVEKVVHIPEKQDPELEVVIPEEMDKDRQIDYILKKVNADGSVVIQTNRVIVVNEAWGWYHTLCWVIGFSILCCFALWLFICVIVMIST